MTSVPALAGGRGAAHPEAMKDMDMKHADEGEPSEGYCFGNPGDSSGVTRAIKVTAMDIKFEPTELAVKVGETVKFEVANMGGLKRELALGAQANQEEHEKEMQEIPSMSMDHDDPHTVSINAGETRTPIWRFT